MSIEISASARPRISRTSTGSTIGVIAFIGATAMLATAPTWATDFTQLTLVEMFYFLSFAQMWNLLAGFAGLVTVGQQGFVGVSAYALFVFSEKNGIDPYVSIVMAGVFVAVLSVPVALFAFRLHGGYFAVGTWVIAEVLRLITLRIDRLGAGNVQSLTVRNTFANYDLETRQLVTYWVALALAAGSVIVVVLVLRSRIGLALQAVRDNEAGARSLGVNSRRTRLIVWVIAAGWTGMTGALVHLQSATVTNRDAFSVLTWTALVLFIVVIGGVGSTLGPVIGVVIYWFINDRFENADNWRFIVLGAVAVAMAVVAPKGIDGLLQRFRPFQAFPIRPRVRQD